MIFAVVSVTDYTSLLTCY